MTESDEFEPRQRNRNFEHTHQILIRKAVAMISESGADAVTISALAQATRINRSTVYYHFESREALIAEVCRWSSAELAKGINPDASYHASTDHVPSFVLHNPEIIRLWIDEYLAAGDIRERYPEWDSLVAQVGQVFADTPDQECDAEVYCALMLTSTLIAPHVFKNSVRPQESLDRIVDRFAKEQQRLMQRGGHVATPIVAQAADLRLAHDADLGPAAARSDRAA